MFVASVLTVELEGLDMGLAVRMYVSQVVGLQTICLLSRLQEERERAGSAERTSQDRQTCCGHQHPEGNYSRTYFLVLRFILLLAVRNTASKRS